MSSNTFSNMGRVYLIFTFLFLALLDVLQAGVLGQAQFSDSSTGLRLSLTTTTNASSTDLHLQLTGETSDGWGAVGIGSGMVGALMFIIYPNSNQDGVTVSVRSASSQSMPTPISGIDYAVQSSSISGGKMTANFVCYECTSWSGGTLDVTSKSQSWIYAVGPGTEVASDDTDATIRQHSTEGNFQVDMTTAAKSSSSSSSSSPSPSSGSTSSPTSASSGSSGTSGSGSSGSNSGTTVTSSSSSSTGTQKLVLAHAGLLIATFVGLLPLGAILLRLPWALGFSSHWIFQLTGTAAGIAGLGVAIAMSIKKGEPYNKFQYAHQILGLIVLSLLLFQAAAGFLHHLNFKKTGRRSFISWGHMFFGHALIIGGMINAILGFRLEYNLTGQIAVGVVSLVVLIVMEAATAWARSRKSRSSPRLKHSSSNETSPPHSLEMAGRRG